jgi:hypothetical protein
MPSSTAQELYSAFLGLAGAPALKEVDKAILVEIKHNQPVIGYWKLVGILGLHEQRVLDSLHKLCEEGLVFVHRDGWRLTSEGARVAQGISESAQIEANGGGKLRPNGGAAWRPPSKSFFLDLRLKNPFYADLSIRRPERLRRW